MGWKTVHYDRLVDSRWVRVDKNKVELPNGMMIEDFYTISISAAAVVALTPE